MNAFDVLDFYNSPIPLSVDGIQISVTSISGAVSTTNPVGYVNGSYPDLLGTNLSETLVVEISPTTDVHFRVGTTPVATTNDLMIFKGNNKKVICKNNEKVSFIKADGVLDGFVNISALRKG